MIHIVSCECYVDLVCYADIARWTVNTGHAIGLHVTTLQVGLPWSVCDALYAESYDNDRHGGVRKSHIVCNASFEWRLIASKLRPMSNAQTVIAIKNRSVRLLIRWTYEIRAEIIAWDPHVTTFKHIYRHSGYTTGRSTLCTKGRLHKTAVYWFQVNNYFNPTLLLETIASFLWPCWCDME